MPSASRPHPFAFLVLAIAAATLAYPTPIGRPRAEAQAQTDTDGGFDAWFLDKTMRVDYFHSGGLGTETLALDQVVSDGPWAGSRTRLVDDLNLGKYLFEVIDRRTNRVVYSRGFASIYGEWETTPESRQVHRTFHESLRFPWPRQPVQIVLNVRDAENSFHELWSTVVDPDSRFVNPADRAPIGKVWPIVESGSPADKVDLLVIGEGYTQSELDKFHADAKRLVTALFEEEPFRSRRSDFNVWGLDLPSAESGVTRPRAMEFRRTPLSAQYNIFDSERYLLTYDNRALRDAASAAPYEFLEILANEAQYGGGGIFNFQATAAADTGFAEYVFIHEFGHHFAGLADEYYTSDVAYETGGTEHREPWEPNVTALHDSAALKWGDLVAPDTPLPTPWDKDAFERVSTDARSERRELRAEGAPESEMDQLFTEQMERETALLGAMLHADKVGAFEGASYEPVGLYRSEVDCLMFTRNPVGFCRVCQRAITHVIDQYSRPKTANGREPMDHSLISALTDIVGADHVVSNDAERATYEADGLAKLRATPGLVVLPGTAVEVQQVVRCCHDSGVPFVARGQGTGLSGGALPHPDGVLIVMTRLNRILDLDIPNRRITVEPGITNLEVTNAAAPHGYYYAPDPSSQVVCSIGGNVAENSGGAHCLKYGFTVHHVVGVEAVLPDGEMVQIGGPALDPPGLDLLGVLVGSEGTLAVVTKVTLRLLRKPASVKTLLAAFGSTEAAGNAVSGIIAKGIIPAAVEMMDRLTIEASEAAVHPNFPQAEALLIVELDGAEAEVAALFDEVTRVCEEADAEEIRIAKSEEERARFWLGRKAAFAAMGRVSPSYYVQDGVIPRTRLSEVLRRIKELGDESGLRIGNVFHAGDGNLHPLICYDERVDGEADLAHRVASEILTICLDVGGSITGEHGVGADKAKHMPKMFTDQDLDTMQLVRCAFDPSHVCNPDKIFPTPRLCGEVPGPYRRHPAEAAGLAARL